MFKRIVFILKSVSIIPLLLCGGGGQPAVQPYKPAPKGDDPAVQAAILKERELAMKRKGRKSTILTPMTGDEPQGNTLLGG